MYPQISTWFWCPAFAFALSLGLSWRVKQPTAAWFHLIVAKNGIPISWWRPQDVYRNELTNWRNKWINLYIYHTYIIHILYIYIYIHMGIYVVVFQTLFRAEPFPGFPHLHWAAVSAAHLYLCPCWNLGCWSSSGWPAADTNHRRRWKRAFKQQWNIPLNGDEVNETEPSLAGPVPAFNCLPRNREPFSKREFLEARWGR